MKVLATLAGIIATLSVGEAASKSFDVTTFSGQHCDGINQGETIVPVGQLKCVSYSNAGSYRIHSTGTLPQCNRVRVVKFHPPGCGGTSYEIVYKETGGNPYCNLLIQSTNPGSAIFSCAD